MLYPLCSQALINATVFGVENAVYRHLSRGERDVNYWNKFVASITAGAAQSLIVCPTELIKIRMQNQGVGERYSERKIGPWKATVSIWKDKGIRGLFKGNWLTMAREVPQYAIYFYTFTRIQSGIASRRQTDLENLRVHENAVAGGITGVVTWLWYPVDVIKTRFQDDGASQKYTGIWDCVKKIRKEEGLKAFFRGIRPTLLRGLINGAVLLPVVEIIKHRM